MFTVVICDEHIINDCRHKYYVYLKPFLKNNEFKFCKWNCTGNTLDEAVPELRDLISHKKEWRVIVVNDRSTWNFEAVNKRNPFDYVNSFKKEKTDYSDFLQIKNSREYEIKNAESALTNPLTRLSIWLCGSPIGSAPGLCYDEYREFIDNADDGKQYYARLAELSVSPQEAEMDWVRSMRFEKISRFFELRGELFNPPQTIIAITQRTKDVEEELTQLAWNAHIEFDYSQFYLDNLYPEKLRYLIYDIPYLKGVRNEGEYFSFLTALLLLASNECPRGAMRSNRVYKLHTEIDTECVQTLYNRYRSKLCETLIKIDDLEKRLAEKEKQPIDKKTAEECFESHIKVPVKLLTHESRKNLMAQYKKIGLSRDCPADEYEYWDSQYHSINKSFVRFLREPRRAVKTAAREDFRLMNRINDERAMLLNEYQLDDIVYNLDEEERSMVDTVTTQLYNAAEYKKKIDEADKEVRHGIAQRMTRRKTVLVGLVAALAYLFGFLPLIFGNLNDVKSLCFSTAVTGIVLAIFLAIGLFYLFVLRRRLIGCFKRFNSVMSGILNEIERGVSAFSKYLSHACNVMREFSVLHFSKDSINRKKNVLSYHKRNIVDRMSDVKELFSDFIDVDECTDLVPEAPYNFDFSNQDEYEYDMPYSDIQKEIEFMQEHNVCSVPVDYIKSVKITREELYD